MIQSGNATLLQHFSKDYFAVDVEMSKCLHVTSANVLFCTHHIGNMNYRSSIMATFPIGSIGKTKSHVRIDFNIGVAINESHSYTLTSAILKVDVIYNITLSNSKVFNTELRDLQYSYTTNVLTTRVVIHWL